MTYICILQTPPRLQHLTEVEHFKSPAVQGHAERVWKRTRLLDELQKLLQGEDTHDGTSQDLVFALSCHRLLRLCQQGEKENEYSSRDFAIEMKYWWLKKSWNVAQHSILGGTANSTAHELDISRKRCLENCRKTIRYRNPRTSALYFGTGIQRNGCHIDVTVCGTFARPQNRAMAEDQIPAHESTPGCEDPVWEPRMGSHLRGHALISEGVTPRGHVLPPCNCTWPEEWTAKHVSISRI